MLDGEWFHEEELVAFVTLSPEGSILERGPQGLLEKKETLHPVKTRPGWQGALHLALEQARLMATKRRDEILALLRELKRGMHRGNHLILSSGLPQRLTGSHGMNVLRWPVFETDELESDALPFRAFIQRQQDGRWQPGSFAAPFQHGIWRDTGLILVRPRPIVCVVWIPWGEELGQRLLHATPTDLKDSLRLTI